MNISQVKNRILIIKVYTFNSSAQYQIENWLYLLVFNFNNNINLLDIAIFVPIG